MNEVETYNVPLSRARITVVDRSYNVVRRPRSVLRSAAREINRERGGGGERRSLCTVEQCTNPEGWRSPTGPGSDTLHTITRNPTIKMTNGT